MVFVCTSEPWGDTKSGGGGRETEFCRDGRAGWEAGENRLDKDVKQDRKRQADPQLCHPPRVEREQLGTVQLSRLEGHW